MVVAIIVILVGITLAAINAMYSKAAESQARAILGALASVEKEYRAQSGGAAIPATANGDLDNTANRFTDVINSAGGPPAEMLLSVSQSPDFVTITSGRVTHVRDPWGKLYRYNDGSGNLANGMPKHNYPYFASSGADGKWGTFSSTDNKPNAAAEDNLYSFDIN